jgi:hypothetical protein
MYIPILPSRRESPSLSATTPAEPAQTSVTLIVGRPTNPQFWLFNEGTAPAQQPKHGFLLYDLDEKDTEQPRRILHIPFQRFDDYIPEKRALGPWRILDLSRRAREVPTGHRVFGYVTVQCLNCRAPRIYWLFFTNGDSGWFRELPPVEAAVVNRTLATIIYSREHAVDKVEELIPKAGRVQFG